MSKLGSYRFGAFGAKTRAREITKLKEGAIARQDLEWMRHVLRKVSRPKIADIGSGAGNCTKEIADALPQANVIGLEPELALHRLAQSVYGHARNLQFRRIKTGHLLRLKGGAYDLITSRLVMHHVSSFEDEVAGILHGLKSGGWVWIFDIDVSTFRLEPWEPALKQLWDKIIRARKALGGSPEGGARLPAILSAAGFTNVRFLRSNLSCNPVVKSSFHTLYSRWLNTLPEKEQRAGERRLSEYLLRASKTGAVCFSPFVFSLVAQKPPK